MDVKRLILKARSYRSFASNVEIENKKLIEWVDYARRTNSTMNKQVLKYKIVDTAEEKEKMLSIVRFGSAIKNMKLPPKNHEPSAYIVICIDKTITGENYYSFFKDAGISAEAIMLMATNEGFGGCILGSGVPEKIVDEYSLPKYVVPTLVIALGKPDEKVVMCDVPEDGNVSYFRDENNVHHVPKRKIDDILL